MVEKDNTFKVLLWGLIAVLLAVVLITSISDQTNNVTKRTIASGETTNLFSNGCWHLSSGVEQVNGTADSDCNITVTHLPTDWRTQSAEGCGIGSVIVTNSSGKALTLNTDYLVFPYEGKIQMLNTTKTSSAATGLGSLNTTLVYYDYCGTGYVNSGWGREILGTNVGLVVIAILIIAVASVYLLLKRKGEED